MRAREKEGFYQNMGGRTRESVRLETERGYFVLSAAGVVSQTATAAAVAVAVVAVAATAVRSLVRHTVELLRD